MIFLSHSSLTYCHFSKDHAAFYSKRDSSVLCLISSDRFGIFRTPSFLIKVDTSPHKVKSHWTLFFYLSQNPLFFCRIMQSFFLTYDGKTAKIYLDSKIRSKVDEVFEFVGTNDLGFRIGCAKSHPQYIFKNGSIDEVGLWRRALSQAEIETAMKVFSPFRLKTRFPLLGVVLSKESVLTGYNVGLALE